VAQETYSYGASNHRLKTVYANGLGAPATYYGWDGGQVISEYRDGISSNLTWEKHYVYLGGRLLATTDSSGTKYHHPDRLGTRLVTDGASGAILTEQTNLPFGTAFTGESSGAINNRRFTSYDRSATTGMDYAVNRFYSAAQGRFTQVDPIGMSAASLEEPQTLNLYSYCGNDPVNHLDPDGLFWGKVFGWIGKAFKFLFKVIAVALVVVAMVLLPTMIAAGGFWLASGAWFGWGSWAGLMAAAGAAGLAGWHNGKLGEIAGAFLTTIGKGANFRTPPINGGEGVSGVNSFQQENRKRRRRPTPTPSPTPPPQGPYVARITYEQMQQIHDKGQFYGESQECVALVKHFSNAPAAGLFWKEGEAVFGNSVNFGTAIASGWERGRYPNRGTGNHGGFFVTQDSGGIWIFDQWPGKKGGAGLRYIHSLKDPKTGQPIYTDPSNNANCFRVIK
jgi:RHS repeat-associated protein